MKKIILILLILIAGAANAQKKQLPNIVYILADDLGYGDVSVYNPKGKIATPNIDKLASEGMRFTDAHSPSSVCTPTRYSLMTGRYPWRSRLPVGVLRGYSRTLIEEDRPTVASLLKSYGYQTAVIGKWHLGLDWALNADNQQLSVNQDYGITTEMNPQHIDFTKAVTKGPNTAGFNYSYILPASLDMPPYCYLENHKLIEPLTAYTDGNKLKSGYTGPFWREGKMSPSFDFNQVLPTFVRKASDYIKNQSKEKPFFLYLPMPAPHTPWLPTAGYKGKSKAGEYGDFVQQVDGAIGEILKTLKDRGLSQNTIVIFTSDNGPYWRQNYVEQFGHRASGEFRGMKGDAFEGGHRIPFIVRWPHQVKANSVSTATTTLANLMATCQEIVGDSNPLYSTEDSYSILDVLLNKSKTVITQTAVVHSSSVGFFAIRKGDWKLIEGLGSGGFTEPRKLNPVEGQPTGQLYNLATDISETEDVYLRYPDKVKELSQLLIEIKNSKTKFIQN